MSVHDAIERAVTRRRIGRDDHLTETLRRADELYVEQAAARLDVPADTIHALHPTSEVDDGKPT